MENMNPRLTRDEFLSVFDDWFKACREQTNGKDDAGGIAQFEASWRQAVAEAKLPPMGHLRDFCTAMRQTDVRMPYLIQKSNYLARRFFVGDIHRTEKCPVHNGHYTGGLVDDCPHKCGGTGFLFIDVKPWSSYV